MPNRVPPEIFALTAFTTFYSILYPGVSDDALFMSNATKPIVDIRKIHPLHESFDIRTQFRV
jgi:hypothetical protein